MKTHWPKLFQEHVGWDKGTRAKEPLLYAENVKAYETVGTGYPEYKKLTDFCFVSKMKHHI